MRSLPALALLLGCLTAAEAQRGGAGAHAGGFAGGARGGFSGGARGSASLGFGGGLRSAPSFGARPGGIYRPSAGPYAYRPSVRGFGYGYSVPRGIYAHPPNGFRPGTGRYPYQPNRYHPYPYGYAPGILYGPVLNFGYDSGFAAPYWGWNDLYPYDQNDLGAPYAGAYSDPSSRIYGTLPDPNDPAQQAYGYPQNDNPAQPDTTGSPYGNETPYGVPQAPQSFPGVVSSPGYAPYGYAGSPPVTVITLPSAPQELDPVTIFYRDGRPPEQIRNYALTRTALLITGPRMREIPLSDIDLPLTQRVAKAMGVEFRIPAPN